MVCCIAVNLYLDKNIPVHNVCHHTCFYSPSREHVNKGGCKLGNCHPTIESVETQRIVAGLQGLWTIFCFQSPINIEVYKQVGQTLGVPFLSRLSA